VTAPELRLPDALVAAGNAAAEAALGQSAQSTLRLVEIILSAVLPLHAAQVRAEVVRECVMVARRTRDAEARHNAQRRYAEAVGAQECGDAIEVALRALLPDTAPKEEDE
jgi:hypothetical protein